MKKYQHLIKYLYFGLGAASLGWIIVGSVDFFTQIYLSGKLWRFELYVCLFLMPLNWSLEAIKIQFLSKNKIGFGESITAVCKGMSFSFFIPFGLGTIVGRSVQQNRDKALLMAQISLLSSFVQSVVSISFGLYFLQSLMMDIQDTRLQNVRIMAIVSLLVLLLLFGLMLKYFPKLSQWMKNKVETYWMKQSLKFNEFSTVEILILFGISIIRYTVYVFQFVILLYLFEKLDISLMISVVCIIYLLQSILYLPSSINALARGGILALILFYFSLPKDNAMGISWTLFWINIAIPTIIGFYYLIRDSSYFLNLKIKT